MQSLQDLHLFDDDQNFQKQKEESINELIKDPYIMKVLSDGQVGRDFIEENWVEFLDFQEDVQKCKNCMGLYQCHKVSKGMKQAVHVENHHLKTVLVPCKYGKEILTFMLRLLITLGIELLLALLFKFDKKSFVIIAITNAVTQIGLNIALNLTAYFNGKSVFYIYYYILIELLIVVVEAVVYRLLCKRGKDGTKKWIISYAILANVLSFVIGVLLWFLV